MRKRKEKDQDKKVDLFFLPPIKIDMTTLLEVLNAYEDVQESRLKSIKTLVDAGVVTIEVTEEENRMFENEFGYRIEVLKQK